MCKQKTATNLTESNRINLIKSIGHTAFSERRPLLPMHTGELGAEPGQLHYNRSNGWKLLFALRFVVFVATDSRIPSQVSRTDRSTVVRLPARLINGHKRPKSDREQENFYGKKGKHFPITTLLNLGKSLKFND